MKAPARIERATEADIPAWAALRARLWPADAAAHAAELPALLASWPAQAAFLAHAGDGPLVGFAEASLRRDYVNGTSTSPVGFLEGWFVDEGWRAQGIGRALVDAVERWSRAQGCRELASDALLENTASHLAHAACGFAETERVVYFRKALD